jgi:uncharacterized membrane protein YagU involved in acid resistance
VLNLTPANIGKGLIAGFAATLVLSLLMVMKQMMGLMPELDVIAMLSRMMGNISPVMAWVAHFMIGTVVWGVLYVVVSPMLPGPQWFRGALFGTAAWLAMMVMIMPVAGAGLFGISLGMMAPIATLMLHWVFGAVLGGVYGAILHPETSATVRAH